MGRSGNDSDDRRARHHNLVARRRDLVARRRDLIRLHMSYWQRETGILYRTLHGLTRSACGILPDFPDGFAAGSQIAG